jgi:hypothetical protein
MDMSGPAPSPLPYSLLKTPGVVVEESAGRWLNGVNLLGYPEDDVLLWEPCSEGTFRVKEEESDWSEPTFDPFVAYLPITCSTLSWSILQERASAVLEATLSPAVEQALVAGIAGSANPYFGDASLTLLATGAAVAPYVALGYLEDAIGDTGRGGLIHATPSVVVQWGDGLEDGTYPVTLNGTRVVSGAGYIGADPATGDTAAAGQAWAFATGPVEVRLGPPVMTDLAESLDRSDNTVTFRAERYVLATWDTALQVGVLVDWSP